MKTGRSAVVKGAPTAGAATLLMLASVLMAHDSPQHGDDQEEPYGGPGYQSGQGGKPGMEFESSNIDLLSWLPIHEFGKHDSASDCWGYVSPSGREYAIIGLYNGTGFVEITDPGLPEILDVIPGESSLWRDIKTYQHYAYAVSEGGGGIQIIDLSEIDDGTITLVGAVTEGGTITTPRTHNVAINEESGYLYRCGGASGTTGLRIYSLADPANPTFVGQWHDRYIHDAQIVTWTEPPFEGREIAFCFSNNQSNGGNAGVDILDVTEKLSIVHLGFTSYSFPAYCHQGWLSPDRTKLYVNDELGEIEYDIPTTTRVIDITDLTKPFEISTYTNGNPSIGHNIYLRDDLIFAANYRSGLRVFDASGDPTQPVETAYFDTYPPNDNRHFNGLWSNYPYFPSGVVIGSDIEKGLFVWDVFPCPADLNDSGEINVSDLLALLGAWGPCDGCAADLNDDGVVNVSDLLNLLADWGDC